MSHVNVRPDGTCPDCEDAMFDKPLLDRSRPLGTPLSVEEAATVARFDQAPDADEALRQRLAHRLYEVDGLLFDAPWSTLAAPQRREYEILADAAIAVIRGDQP